jgi:hypothetical protein
MRDRTAVDLLAEAAEAFYRIARLINDDRAADAEVLALSMAAMLSPGEDVHIDRRYGKLR